MKTSIIKIGNSKGILILKAILAKCKITEDVDLLMDDNKMVIQPINKKSRVGWDSKFKSMSDKKQDKLLIHDSIDLNSKDWEFNSLKFFKKYQFNLQIDNHKITNQTLGDRRQIPIL